MSEGQGRGVKYPGEGLGESIQMLETVRAAVGLSAASRETIASALGYKNINGASARKLASLAHYGLLDRAGNGAMRISALGRRLLMPTSDADHRSALAEAALQPTLFRSVHERFKGQAIPGMLANLLVREFGVFHTSAEAAAATLRETMEFAGMVRNGVLLEQADEEAPPAPPPHPGEGNDTPDTEPRKGRAAADPTTAHPGTPTGTSPQGEGNGDRRYVVALGGDGRMALIDLPIPVTQKDLRRVRLWVDYMESVVAEEDPM
jgi:hypothetical protein